jgi:hypothetical protein
MYTAKDARNTVIDYERNRNHEELEFLLDIADNRIAYDIVIEEIKSLAYKGVSKMLIEKKNKRDAELISLFIETNVGKILDYLGYRIEMKLDSFDPTLLEWVRISW